MIKQVLKIFSIAICIGHSSFARPGNDLFWQSPLPKAQEEKLINYLSDYVRITYKQELFESFLFISYKQQKMYHIVHGRVMRVYNISASKDGLGNRSGSGRTPLGLHEIYDKFGYDVPIGGLIKCRTYTGKTM